MKNLITYKIFEIAENSVLPEIIEENLSYDVSYIKVRIKNKIYLVYIHCRGTIDKTSMQIDFVVEGDTDVKMTNDGDALFVLSNIIGTLKYFFSLDFKTTHLEELIDFNDINICTFVIFAKSENDVIIGKKKSGNLIINPLKDERRQNIYDYYIEKNFTSLGIKIKEKIDITEEYSKFFNINNVLGMKYRIVPITIREIKKSL